MSIIASFFPQRRFCLLLVILAGFETITRSAEPQPVDITVKYFAEAGGDDVNGKAQTAVQEAFYAQHPDIRLKAWTALHLPGNMWQQADLLAVAGGVAADVQPLFFHQIQFYANQGLLAPLDDLVAGPGSLRDYWQSLPPSFRQASTVDGKVYAIPTGCYGGTFLFRREVFEEAGLDPDKPPATLEDFWRACQKLTDPNRIGPDGEKLSRYAMSSDDLVGTFMPFFFATGATFVKCQWLDSSGRVVLETRIEDEPPPSAQSLGLKRRLCIAFDTPEAREALRWIYRFRWAPWVRDPQTGAIRDLTEVEAAVTPGVIRGVVRPVLTQDDKDTMTLLTRGLLAMISIQMNPRTWQLNDTSLGMCPFPPLKAGDPSPAPLLPLMMGLNRMLVAHPDKWAAAKQWLIFRAGPQAARIENQVYADNGMTREVSTWELRHAGMDDLLPSLPPQWVAAEDYIFAGKNIVPFINGWTAIQQELEAGVIKPMLDSPAYDYDQALTDVAATANDKVLGLASPATQEYRTHWSIVVLAVVAIALVLGGREVVKSQLRQARTAATSASALVPGTKQSRVLLHTILLLGPALLLLAVFGYYPVGRGLVMAFQDYHLAGPSTFVGLKNFSEGLFASRFWIAAINTLVFVGLNLGLGFLMPFFLAILVSELPVGTALFRTVYYLPAVTAGLVVTLLWMRLYDPTEYGLLNEVLRPVFSLWNDIAPSAMQAAWPVNWLQNPKWAMLAVIVPTIWASAGPGSLIYLAALKGIPEEMYEAADLDGCGPWSKFIHITLPAIFPLLLINFIGAFIGTFQSMGNIFVMTGGGPNYATHVLALEIWQNAFLYLRFGVATAQAWILAATLIGAVVLQLRVLERMDWRRAGS